MLLPLAMAAPARQRQSREQQETIATYTNPLLPRLADPFVLHDGGIYYLYGTSIPHQGFEVYSSDDLVHWRRRGVCYRRTRESWADTDFWAPEVVKTGNTYTMFFVARNTQVYKRNIGVAAAASPLGPFHEVAAPLIKDGRSYIDPHVFHDRPSGKWYLYVVEETAPPGKILGAELSASLTQLASPLQQCLVPDQRWEERWIEGAFVVQHGSRYHMMYSGSFWWNKWYAVGCAVAGSPLGPWRKYDNNPILSQSSCVYGPGHNCAIESPDGNELFAIYHTHRSARQTDRRLAIDRVEFRKDSAGQEMMVMPNAPSCTPQPLPSGAKPRGTARSDEFASRHIDFSQWMTIGENADTWRVTNGQLEITTEDCDWWEGREDARNVFYQYAPLGDYELATKVAFECGEDFQQAFLMVFSDPDNYIKFGTMHSGTQHLLVARETSGKYEETLTSNTLGTVFHLRITKRGDTYQLGASADGKNWLSLGEIALPGEGPKQMKIGLAAWSPTTSKQRVARFDYFRVRRLSTD